MMRWSAHLSMLFVEHDPLERPAAAARSGFTLVESWWPPGGNPGGWADAVAAAGIGVAALNADGGNIAAGERGFCTQEELAPRVLSAMAQALDLARRVDAPIINVLAGRLDPERSRGGQRTAALEVLRECGDMAREAGRVVVVESLNALDVPDYLLTDPAEAVTFLEDVAHPSVRLLYDAYHAARAGDDPVRDVRAFADLIGHVQYADSPDRGAPGTGSTDLAAFVEALDRAHYSGAVGLEFDPAGDTARALSALPAMELIDFG